MTQSRIVLGLAIVLSVLAGGIGTAVMIDAPAQPVQGQQQTPATNQAAPQPLNITTSSAPYKPLYDQAIDSVVTIRVQSPRGSSQGSGFVYNQNGYIVTNEHVVGSAEEVLVRFSNGTWRQGSVVGTDVYTDLAVVQVDSLPDGVEPLPVASTNPEQGQPVAALGSPLGLEGSISSGIISGVNRSMETSRGFSIPATVQTDAPINPGNSGGPLVSLNGTVVGVNRAKSGDNIGFAISPLLIQRVVPELIANGEYNHPYMGIQTVPVTPTIADTTSLDRARGVMVVGLIADGPSAGVLQPATERARVNGRLVRTGGDIILSIDGRPIRSQQQLARSLMLHTRPGETIDVTILRDGTRQTVQVTLGTRPEP